MEFFFPGFIMNRSRDFTCRGLLVNQQNQRLCCKVLFLAQIFGGNAALRYLKQRKGQIDEFRFAPF